MFQYLLCVITTHAIELFIAVLAFVGAILLTLARQQLRHWVVWIVTPLIDIFPWNQNDSTRVTIDHSALVSELTIVDVFLLDAEGKIARYQKTSSYIAMSDLDFYREAVTAEGHATAFFTMRGLIVETGREHGFYISRIQIAEALPQGGRFTNVYGAELRDCFTRKEEHWTQELAVPKKHLTIQIHFPEGRPPRLIRCQTVEGTQTIPTMINAKLVELFGRKSIVWELDDLHTNQVFKLEWSW